MAFLSFVLCVEVEKRKEALQEVCPLGVPESALSIWPFQFSAAWGPVKNAKREFGMV